jgi:hypothetical protein
MNNHTQQKQDAIKNIVIKIQIKENKTNIQENKNREKLILKKTITWYRNPLRASTLNVNQVLCLDFCLASAAVRSSLETSFSKYESGCPAML